MILIFWTSVIGILFIYAGYPVVLFLLSKIKGKTETQSYAGSILPEVAIVIAAYNEEDIIKAKIENTMALDYPGEKLKIYVVADGSNDATAAIALQYDGVTVLHQYERKGKSAAINRVMKFVKEPITVFTDANVMINTDALLALVKQYNNSKTGAVSGEKVVMHDDRAAAASTEGAYWKYESYVKRKDAELSTIVGAAGELFSVRTALFEEIAEDTLLDDFMISMSIVRKGYSVKYEPKALASEKPSFNIEEEYKRKVRIAAGGIQSIQRNLDFCNPLRHGLVSFQFLIHRVSRWTVAPVFIVAAFVANLFLIGQSSTYTAIFFLQVIFHLAALTGYYFSTRQVKVKLLHIPFYFDFMHYCVVMSWFRYSRGKQKAVWQKATRLSYN